MWRPLTACLVLLSLASLAEARPPYLEAFSKLYGLDADLPVEQWQRDLKTRAAAVRCNVCHVPDHAKTERNEYGLALERKLPEYDDAAFRSPSRGPAAYQQVYRALKAVEPEVSRARYRYGELIKNGYLPTYKNE